MRWPATPNPWRRRFAFLPICVGGEWLWLDWFWSQFQGEYVAISFDDPNREAAR